MTSRVPELKIGKAYFLCGYYLRNLPTPTIETWIYLGPNLHEGEDAAAHTFHYFEAPEVYYAERIAEERVQYDLSQSELVGVKKGEPDSRLRLSDSDLESLVYDYEGLCEWVVSLRGEQNANSVF